MAARIDSGPPYMPTFACIEADPPWPETGGGKVKRGADRHYRLAKNAAEIAATMQAAWTVVGGPLDSALLWLWATSYRLRMAFEVLDLLGFRYATNLVWVKTGRPGLGQRTRQRHEFLLIGVRGTVPFPETQHRPDSVIEAPRGRHSEKPSEAYTRIERACSGPRLSMFARGERVGWVTWGDDGADATVSVLREASEQASPLPRWIDKHRDAVVSVVRCATASPENKP